MKVKTITFMQTFPTGQFANQKLGMEIEVDNNLSELEIKHYFKDIQDKVEKAFVEMNPQINWASNPVFYNSAVSIPSTGETIQPAKDERIQSFIATINLCTSLKFLKNFETRVHQENNQDLLDAYNKKLSEFL